MNQLKVFISYRRSDTQHVAGRLGDRIGTRFTLFMDIDDIPPGVDFTTVVRRAIDESDVLLVLIGPHFLGVGADGERRLDKSGDWVAEEVGTGLARDIAVVPVLVDGAQMPSVADLPGKLKGLAHRQALRLTHVSFNSDAERLIETLDNIERIKFGTYRSAGPTRSAADPHRVTCSAIPTIPGPLPPRSTGVGRRRSSCSKPSISGFPTTTGSVARSRTRGAVCTSSNSRRKRPRPNVTDIGARRPRAWRNWRPRRPDDTDLLDRLERAKREARIEDLSGQLRAMFVAEEWVGVGVLSSQIAQIDPERADPEGLATTAAGNLVDRQLGERYATALAAYAEGRSADALAEFEAIQEQRPGFREVDDLVAMLRQRLGIGTGGAAGARAGRRFQTPEPAQTPAPEPERRRRFQPGGDHSRPEAPVDRDAAAPAPLADSGLTWLAVLAVGVLFVMTQVTFSSYGAIAPLLGVVLLGLGILVGLLVRDARRLDARRGRMLRISAIWAPVVGVGSLLASVPLVDYLDNNVVDVDTRCSSSGAS